MERARYSQGCLVRTLDRERFWGKFTDDDLEMIQGRSERFVGKLQERYGQSQADAERDLDNWLKSLPPSERAEKSVREKQRV